MHEFHGLALAHCIALKFLPILRLHELLADWDKITTVCNGVPDALEAKQVMTATGVQKCSKSPLAVQKFIGASSTLDPLFKADKLMIRAQPLVADEDSEKYSDAVDLYIARSSRSRRRWRTHRRGVGSRTPMGAWGRLSPICSRPRRRLRPCAAPSPPWSSFYISRRRRRSE